ncbi:MAG: hypothetical protein QM538_05130 [Methylacidiphilales bacterium]|nr:hypothetical protein [Candidatus Methylacidiphilales bacterium]
MFTTEDQHPLVYVNKYKSFGYSILIIIALCQCTQLAIANDETGNIDKNLSGEINYSILTKGNIEDFQYLQSISARLKWRDTFDEIFTVQVDLYLFNSSAKYNFEMNYGYNKDGNSVFEISSRHSYYRFDETFIQVENDYLVWRLGNQKFVWGQNKIFSPINLLLPINHSEYSVKKSISEYLYPMLSTSLLIYPIPELEIGLYYYFNHTRDPTSHVYIDYLKEYAKHDNIQITPDCAKNQQVGSGDCSLLYAYDSVGYASNSNSQSAFRLLYSKDVNIGVTYFEGFWGQVPGIEGKKLKIVESGLPKHYNLHTDFGNGYAFIRAIGLELAIPVGRYSLEFDLLSLLNKIPFYDDENYFGSRTIEFDLQSYNSNCDLNKYYYCLNNDAILAIKKNNNKVYDEATYSYLSIGFSYLGENLDAYFYFYGLQIKFKKVSNDSQSYYNKKTYQDGIPTFVVRKYLDDERKETLSFLFGNYTSCNNCFGIGMSYENQSYEEVQFNLYLAHFVGDYSFNYFYIPDLPKIINIAKQYRYLSNTPTSPRNQKGFASPLDFRTRTEASKGADSIIIGFGVTYYY